MLLNTKALGLIPRTTERRKESRKKGGEGGKGGREGGGEREDVRDSVTGPLLSYRVLLP